MIENIKINSNQKINKIEDKYKNIKNIQTEKSKINDDIKNKNNDNINILKCKI